MRFKLALTLVVALFCAARAQDKPTPQDQQIIDEFVTTRGFVFVEPGGKKPAPKATPRPGGKGGVAQTRPRFSPKKGEAPKGGAAAGATTTAKQKPEEVKGGGATGGEPAEAASAGDVEALKAGGAGRPIALGYTLYKRTGGRLVVTDESKEFVENDEMRISLETNTDAYVYVFNTTNGAAPMMLYPYVGVERGANRVAAHRRDYVPAASDYVFNNEPGTERVYIVVTRHALAGVPTGEELIAHCRGALKDCYWQPTPDEWARLEARLRAGAGGRAGRTPQLARLQSSQPDTLTRGLRIKPEEPPPAVVRVSDSPTADLLLTTIDLIHK